VSRAFAPTNIIGHFGPVPSLTFALTAAASFGPLKAIAPIVAATKDPDSTQTDEFMIASLR
jgi:hypothetical protein